MLQQDVPAVDPDKAVTMPRLGTVATSGLLLVEAADGANLPSQGRRSGSEHWCRIAVKLPAGGTVTVAHI